LYQAGGSSSGLMGVIVAVIGGSPAAHAGTAALGDPRPPYAASP
jgi:hypothetical protein